MGAHLKWINEPPNWQFDHNNRLMLKVPQGADFFRNPCNRDVKFSAPFLYKIIRGDFIVFTRVNVEMRKKYDSGCLMVISDVKNWAKICYEYVDGVPTIVSVVTKNTSDCCNSEKIGIKKPYLKITRFNNCISFYYSIDSKKWKLIRSFGMDCSMAIKLGVTGQCPSGEGCSVNFDLLEYSGERIKI